MKHLSSLLALLALTISPAPAQVIVITFEGELNGVPLPLDSVHVLNLDQGGDTMLYAPDTVLVLGSTGLGGLTADRAELLSIPNPFSSRTEIHVPSLGPEELTLSVHDLTGRKVAALQLPGGPVEHRVAFQSAQAGVHVLSVEQGGTRRSARLLALQGEGNYFLEPMSKVGQAVAKSGGGGFVWYPGDRLLYIGHSSDNNDALIGSIQTIPMVSSLETFAFAIGVPCSGSPTVTDIDGNTYATVQIGNQCWMAENLRTSHYRDGSMIYHQWNNWSWSASSTPAWCNYDNDPANDSLYGKLYNWYATVQPMGLCPQGWHVPRQAEWQQLDVVLGVPAWELSSGGFRGEAQNAGGKMKNTTGWNPLDSATNVSGFSALPSGFRYETGGGFVNIGYRTGWWSTTTDPIGGGGSAASRRLDYYESGIGGPYSRKRTGLCVRCVRD